MPAIILVSFAAMLLLMPRDLFVFDEGIILVDAVRVFHGDIVHRDFYSTYGPAQYYLVGALFQIFGQGFLIERLYDILIRAIGIAVLFVVLRARVASAAALTYTVLGAFWMTNTLDAPIYPVFPCIPLALIGTFLLTAAPRGPISFRTLAAAGSIAGLCALFRYDVGFLVALAHVAPIGWRTWRSVPKAERVGYWLKAVTIYAGAALLVFSPAAILILANSALAGFVADVIDYPAKYYARMRSLPLPGLWGFQMHPMKVGLYFPVAAGLLSLFEVFRFLHRRSARSIASASADEEADMEYLIGFGALSALLFIKGFVRMNEIHMVLAIIPALVIFAIVVKRWREGVVLRAATVVGVLVVLVPTVDALKEQVGHSYRQKDRAVVQWLVMRLGLILPPPEARTACTTVPAMGIAKLSPDYVRAVNYLDAYTRPNEPILVGLKRHDIVPGNAMALYFVANRSPATHWAQYDPGQQTRADIQATMIDELKRNSVRWIVRDGSFDYHNEPNDSSKSSGVKLLDDYIDRNYREVAASGNVSIWLNNAEAARPAPVAGDCLDRRAHV